MIFQSYIPKFPLDQFVDYFLYHAENNPTHIIDRFLPDGNVEIIINLNDAPQYIYNNETFREIQACHNVWASGVRTEYISIPSGKDSAMMVISFKKGMAYPFFPIPMNEISDCVIDADLLWGNDFSFLRERILENEDTNLRFQIIEDFLLKNFLSKMTLNLCVGYALSEILSQPDKTNMGELSNKIGYSQKHFIKMFKEQVGITPKAYLKIMRFQKVVNEIEKTEKIDWTLISHTCGFYDQAHFINDFKLFSGFTPVDYVELKSEFLNYVPVA